MYVMRLVPDLQVVILSQVVFYFNWDFLVLENLFASLFGLFIWLRMDLSIHELSSGWTHSPIDNNRDSDDVGVNRTVDPMEMMKILMILLN